MSSVLTEITKVEPNFNINDFLKQVQYVIIPNVMESIRTGEMEILKDWCTEAVCFYLKELVLNHLIFYFFLKGIQHFNSSFKTM